MKFVVLVVCSFMFFSCGIFKPQPSDNETTLAKLDSINSWYNRLVVKQYSPIYVFQTAVYNQNKINKGYLYDYFLGETDVQNEFGQSNMYDYSLVKNGESQTEFDSEFVKRNFEFAESHLKNKHLSYSKIYLQIPQRKGGYTRDILKLIGLQEAVISKLTRQEFFFDNSIASLVDSKRYNPNFDLSELPNDLIKLIKNRFEKVKTFLPEPYKSKVIHSKLIISEPSADLDPSKLFLHNVNGDVKISSLLIRAILVKAISQEATLFLDHAGSNFELKWPVQLLKIPQLQDSYQVQNERLSNFLYPQNNWSWESSRERFARFNGPDIKRAYDDIIATINSTLDFLFLHEFSHIYLGPNMIDEFRADCYAYSPLKKQNPRVNYGVFSELMITAIKNKGGYYWITSNDSLKLQQIIDRYERLKRIDSLVDRGALTIGVKCDSLNF